MHLLHRSVAAVREICLHIRKLPRRYAAQHAKEAIHKLQGEALQRICSIAEVGMQPSGPPSEATVQLTENTVGLGLQEIIEEERGDDHIVV